jgi:hypothetical protein
MYHRLAFTVTITFGVLASAQTPIEPCFPAELGWENEIISIDFDGCVETPCPVHGDEEKTVKITFKSRKCSSFCLQNRFLVFFFHQ